MLHGIIAKWLTKNAFDFNFLFTVEIVNFLVSVKL